jgi:hypothetical protein
VTHNIPNPPEQAREFPWAEDIDGLWHLRRDDFWDNDLKADVRAHTTCGRDIWSCHVSEFDPREFEDDGFGGMVRVCGACDPREEADVR